MAEEVKNADGTAPAAGASGQFGVQKIYVKDLSFETPNSPQIFQEKWTPAVAVDVANSATGLADNLFEVVLSITITVKFGDKTAYLAEVQQAGIFHVEGFPRDAIARILGSVCPNMLFPFAREVIADLAMRGGFPQLLLAPMNFDTLYQQRLEKAAAAPAAESGTKH
jgi:preprotein translocase subunit SecB